MTKTSCFRWMGLGLAAATLLIPLAVAAQPVGEIAPSAVAAPPDAPPPTHWASRLRFEGGIEGGGFADFYNLNAHFAQGTPNLGFGLGAGIYLRLGLQVNEWLAFQIEGSAGTTGFSGYLRCALAVNLTPVRWFTVSVAPVFGTFGNVGGETDYLGVTLRPDFHVYQYRSASGRRHSFTIGIAGDFGGSVQAGPAAGPIAGGLLNIGYTAH